MTPTSPDPTAVLQALGWHEVSNVRVVGAGAWSIAYGFTVPTGAFVLRLGAHEEDFRLDQAVSVYSRTTLPIPIVHEVGRVPGDAALAYCVSDFVAGDPMEACTADQWPQIAVSLVDALEVMRGISPPDNADVRAWKYQLLALDRGEYDERLSGWRAKLAMNERASAVYQSSVGALSAVDLTDTPMTLLHGDLINRNVHVVDNAISGIFDWGCQRWGDHLFEPAWFEFWAPWHPNLDVGVLLAALQERWEAVDYRPTNEPARRNASLLQIGIDHLAYNASIEKWDDLADVCDRIEALELI